MDVSPRHRAGTAAVALVLATAVARPRRPSRRPSLVSSFLSLLFVLDFVLRALPLGGLRPLLLGFDRIVGGRFSVSHFGRDVRVNPRGACLYSVIRGNVACDFLICAHVDLGFVRIRRLDWIDLQGVLFCAPMDSDPDPSTSHNTEG